MTKLLLTIPFLIACNAYPQLDINIQLLSKQKIIECEPILVEISWQNNSSSNISVGNEISPLYSEYASLLINDAKVDVQKVFKRPQSEEKHPGQRFLKPGEKRRQKIDIRSIIPGSGSYTIKSIIDFSKAPEGSFRGRKESNTIQVIVEKPAGEDLEAYNYAMQNSAQNEYSNKRTMACMNLTTHNTNMEEVILHKYPRSTYAGWILLGWNAEKAGIPLSNAEANKMILGAITRDPAVLNDAPYWQMKSSVLLCGIAVNRINTMEQFAEAAESFVQANKESPLSGWLLASAAFNELGLGNINKSCIMFKESLNLKWELPDSTEEQMSQYKKGVENAIEIMKENKVCK